MPSMVVAQGFWVLRTLIKVGMLKNRCPELFRNSMLTHTHTHTHTRWPINNLQSWLHLCLLNIQYSSYFRSVFDRHNHNYSDLMHIMNIYTTWWYYTALMISMHVFNILSVKCDHSIYIKQFFLSLTHTIYPR